MVRLWEPFNLSEPQCSLRENGVNDVYLSGLSGFNEIKNSCFCYHTCFKNTSFFPSDLYIRAQWEDNTNLAFAYDPCYPRETLGELGKRRAAQVSSMETCSTAHSNICHRRGPPCVRATHTHLKRPASGSFPTSLLSPPLRNPHIASLPHPPYKRVSGPFQGKAPHLWSV